jgi:hypothetical protein
VRVRLYRCLHLPGVFQRNRCSHHAPACCLVTIAAASRTLQIFQVCQQHFQRCAWQPRCLALRRHERVFIAACVSQHFNYLTIEVNDNKASDILTCIPATNIFLESALEGGGKVLVHWYAFVLAFLPGT